MVVAVTAAASTWAPLPKTTPFWFTRITWPLEFKDPLMTEASFPVTRFKVTAFEPEVLKFTVAFLPILKLAQLITASWDDWFTFIVLADCEIVAFPATT